MITTILSVLIFLVSLAGFNNPDIIERFKHYPYRIFRYKEYYRLLTGGFLHGSWTHLLVNLLVFYQFGTLVEKYIFVQVFGTTIGELYYLGLFLLSVIFANTATLFNQKNNYSFSSIGASGAVSAIMFSYVLIQPWSLLYIYFIIPMYTIVAAVLYLVYAQWASKNSQDHVDHLAHFYGSIFGLAYNIIVYPSIFSYFYNELINGFPLK